MNAISVDVETNDKLKKAKLENGFYNIIDGKRVSAGKTLSVVNPATAKQLAIVPDIDSALLDKAVGAAQNAFSGWRAVPTSPRKAILTSMLNRIGTHPSELSCLLTPDYVHDVLPQGVFNVLTGGDDLGTWITSHPGINLITFTGSTFTGKRVLESAAATLKRVTLELGGNDPGVVLSDAEPEKIAQALFDSMFLLSGQGCISLKRLYVHEDIYSRVIEALVAIASATKVVDGFDPHTRLGPVQNQLQYKRLQSVWEEIKRSGAKVLFRGVVSTNTEGLFFPVTLLDNPPDGSSFVTQEVFGPIRSIFRYKNLDEAIRRANNTSYGLGASVWGSDPVQLRTVASQLEAGTVWINQHAIRNPFVPASAYKESGLGVEFGQEGLEAFCNIQVISAKR